MIMANAPLYMMLMEGSHCLRSVVGTKEGSKIVDFGVLWESKLEWLTYSNFSLSSEFGEKLKQKSGLGAFHRMYLES